MSASRLVARDGKVPLAGFYALAEGSIGLLRLQSLIELVSPSNASMPS